MIRKTVAAALTIGLAVAAAPAPASAACSNGALKVCASVSASYNGSGRLVLKVWNLYGAPGQGVSHVMTFVGIGSANWTGTASLYDVKFNGTSLRDNKGKLLWKTVSNINGNPVGAQLDLASQSNSGVNNGLVGCGASIPPGGYISSCSPPSGPFLELEFTTSSVMDLSNAVYGWHSQVVDGTSCSMWVDSNGNSTESSGPGACHVVPEPISMVLLGTGLAGVGGVGVLSRRRKKDDELA